MLQALNWLLRSVTQPTCLHDLLWCFVAALVCPNDNIFGEQNGHSRNKSDADQVFLFQLFLPVLFPHILYIRSVMWRNHRKKYHKAQELKLDSKIFG